MNANASTTFALAAAALFLSGCSKQPTSAGTQNPDQATDGAENATQAAAPSPEGDKKIKCFGINECSGQSACDVPDGRVAEGSVGHSCAGQNECKGKGWILKPASECETAGGEPL